MSYLEDWEGDEDPELYTDLFPEEDKNIYFSVDEWRGGVVCLDFEADETPSSKDFSISYYEVETTDEDWSLINKYYLRGRELESYDYLDSFGSGSYVKIYRSE